MSSPSRGDLNNHSRGRGRGITNGNNHSHGRRRGIENGHIQPTHHTLNPAALPFQPHRDLHNHPRGRGRGDRGGHTQSTDHALNPSHGGQGGYPQPTNYPFSAPQGGRGGYPQPTHNPFNFPRGGRGSHTQPTNHLPYPPRGGQGSYAQPADYSLNPHSGRGRGDHNQPTGHALNLPYGGQGSYIQPAGHLPGISQNRDGAPEPGRDRASSHRPSRSPALVPRSYHDLHRTQINVPDDTAAGPPFIRHVEAIGSYNWLRRGEPTIEAPGCPPMWVPRANNHPLRSSTETYMRDPNTLYWPVHPMEPALRAVVACDGVAKLEKLDFFGCSVTLLHLLRFVKGQKASFQLRGQVVGGVLVLERWINSPELLKPDNSRFADVFLEEYTTVNLEVKERTKHHRVLRYDLAGLRCVVRMECDGYLKEKAMEGKAAEEVTESSSWAGGDADALLAKLTDDRRLASETVSAAGRKLTVEPVGWLVSQDAIIEIKADVDGYGVDFLLLMPGLWVRQARTVIIGSIREGAVRGTQIVDMTGRMEAWERANTSILRALGALICRIRAVVQNTESRKVSITRHENGPLMFTEMEDAAWSGLPPDMMAILST
ncbi:hypothetical protein EJ06DRAFT_584665 [Trichodelitschia bisporula]|uniref:Uncharacterized protein n=1 Tax=Trichodelitschia bisporula TaxID=703511 RepID=A0A6G1HM96_9PEZI|nr:hypothetical protein EJ06DRAFT_584665 [Trichodelitschia bisporula]